MPKIANSLGYNGDSKAFNNIWIRIRQTRYDEPVYAESTTDG